MFEGFIDEMNGIALLFHGLNAFFATRDKYGVKHDGVTGNMAFFGFYCIAFYTFNGALELGNSVKMSSLRSQCLFYSSEFFITKSIVYQYSNSSTFDRVCFFCSFLAEGGRILYRFTMAYLVYYSVFSVFNCVFYFTHDFR